MSKFKVMAQADLTFEVDAENEEEAIQKIAKAFAAKDSYDPLSYIAFGFGPSSEGNARLMTTVIQDIDAPYIEAEEIE